MNGRILLFDELCLSKGQVRRGQAGLEVFQLGRKNAD